MRLNTIQNVHPTRLFIALLWLLASLALSGFTDARIAHSAPATPAPNGPFEPLDSQPAEQGQQRSAPVAINVPRQLTPPPPLACPNIISASETFITNPGAGPNGSDLSVVVSPETGTGTSANPTSFNLADDFYVTANGTAPSEIIFYAYQTGSGTTSTLNGATVSLLSGQPGSGGTVLDGPVTVNANFTTGWTGVYRVLDTAPSATNRPIMYFRFNWPFTNVTTLNIGIYWLQFSITTASAASAFVPLANHTAGDNSLVLALPGSTWILVQEPVTRRSVGLPLVVCRSGATATPTASPTATNTSTPTATATKTNTPVPTRVDTIGVFSAGTWYLRNSNTSGNADITATFGASGDLPVVGDWNGDGIDTIGIYRTSGGVFNLSNSNTAPTVNYTLVFGNPGDTPFAGKWLLSQTHDGVGVFRPANGILYQKNELTTGFSDYSAVFGNPGDFGFAGDWNQDGKDSIGIYRPSAKRWFFTNNSNPNGVTFSDLDFPWDITTNTPVIGDWSGDGRSKVGFLTPNGVVVEHGDLAQTASNNVFAYGPTNAIPVAGKWIAAPAPNPRGGGLLVQPGAGGPPTRVPGAAGMD